MRRLPIICLAIAAAATAAGCSTFSNNDAVAKVGDDELTRDDLADLVATPGAEDSSTDTSTDASDDDTSTGPGEQARRSIFIWVVDKLLTGEVARNGGEVSDADRAEVEEALAADPTFTGESERFQETLINAQATYRAWGEQLGQTPEVQEQYERGPRESGFTCAAHILAATEEEATDVLAQLDEGANFAEVAQTTSTDTGSGQSGGALGCQPTEQFESQFIPEFVAAALDAEVGVPTQPVESEFGWHVIQLQAYEEIAEQFQSFYANGQLGELVESSDVYVDPRYGAISDGEIVPLGGSSTPTGT